MSLLRRLAATMPVVLLLHLAACAGSDEAEPGTPTNTGPAYVLGCRTGAKCVTAMGGSDVTSNEQADRAACASAGGETLLSHGCWPGEGSGCCRTTRGNAHVTTCIYDGDPNDPATTEARCVASGGSWDTVDRSGVNRDTPQTPATFVTGCDFAQRSDPGMTGRVCVLYPATHLGQSCKEPLGVAVTTCTAEGRLGCCRRKGPILGCYYEGEGVTLAGVQAECDAAGGIWLSEPPP